MESETTVGGSDEVRARQSKIPESEEERIQCAPKLAPSDRIRERGTERRDGDPEGRGEILSFYADFPSPRFRR